MKGFMAILEVFLAITLIYIVLSQVQISTPAKYSDTDNMDRLHRYAHDIAFSVCGSLEARRAMMNDTMSFDLNASVPGDLCYSMSAYKNSSNSHQLDLLVYNKSSDSDSATYSSYIESTINNLASVQMQDIAIGDADNDGLNEVVVGHQSTNELRIYDYVAGSWVETNISDTPAIVNSVAIGDADNDGLNEIVIGMYSTTNELRMYSTHESPDFFDISGSSLSAGTNNRTYVFNGQIGLGYYTNFSSNEGWNSTDGRLSVNLTGERIDGKVYRDYDSRIYYDLGVNITDFELRGRWYWASGGGEWGETIKVMITGNTSPTSSVRGTDGWPASIYSLFYYDSSYRAIAGVHTLGAGIQNDSTGAVWTLKWLNFSFIKKGIDLNSSLWNESRSESAPNMFVNKSNGTGLTFEYIQINNYDSNQAAYDIAIAADDIWLKGGYTGGNWTSSNISVNADRRLKNITILHDGVNSANYLDKIEFLINGVVQATYDTDIASGTSTVITAPTGGSFNSINQTFRIRALLVGNANSTPIISGISGYLESTATGWMETNISDLPTTLSSVDIGDANNDGLNDVVVGIYGLTYSNETRMYSNLSGGWVEKNISDVYSVQNVFVADADNDGLNEVIVGHQNGPAELRMYKNISGAWSERIIADVPQNVQALHVGDADNDGLNEIIIGIFSGDNNLRMYKNASGTWIETNISGYSTYPTGVFVNDTDNDGRNEVIVGLYDSTVVLRIYENVSGGWVETNASGVQGNINCVAAGDADNDGLEEIAIGMDFDTPNLRLVKYTTFYPLANCNTVLASATVATSSCLIAGGPNATQYSVSSCDNQGVSCLGQIASSDNTRINLLQNQNFTLVFSPSNGSMVEFLFEGFHNQSGTSYFYDSLGNQVASHNFSTSADESYAFDLTDFYPDSNGLYNITVKPNVNASYDYAYLNVSSNIYSPRRIVVQTWNSG